MFTEKRINLSHTLCSSLQIYAASKTALKYAMFVLHPKSTGVMFCFTFQILQCSLSCASSIMFHVQYIGDIQCLKHHRTLVCDVHCHRSGSFRQRSLKRAQLRACTMYVYMYTCIYTCIPYMNTCIHVYMYICIPYMCLYIIQFIIYSVYSLYNILSIQFV